ncbi:MAG: asparagine synthase C-terminal domain-containing protein, partial [Candidatus Thiodiazotropha sp.]
NSIREYEALQTYEDLLVRAVQRQMLSDVPIAILLSGGVDSALITKIAQDISGECLDTYTAGYAIESAANEFVEARGSAAILNTRHHEVILDEKVFFDTLPSLVKAIEEPLGSQSIFPINFLSSQIHQDGYKVALTGQGVDEPWAGYGRYNSEIYFDKFQSPLLTVFRPLYRLFSHDKVKRGIRALTSGNRVNRFVETYSVFNANMIERMASGLSNVSYRNSLSNLIQHKFEYLSLEEYRGVDAMTFLDARMNLSDDLLLYTDKISMQHSVELRVPFLDLDLMKFAESLPSKLKVTLFKNKVLHKKLSEKFLPKEIVHRKKKGFYTPRREWFKGELGDKYLSLLMEDTGSFSNLINRKYLCSLFIRHKQGAVNYEKQIYLLVVLFYWMRYFVDGKDI